MKPDFYNINDELLVKYLTGETTDDENVQVRAWIAASPENRTHFEHFQIIWEESLQLAAKSTVDEEEAWQRFKQKTATPAIKPPSAPVVPITVRWLRIAIMLVVTAGTAWLSFNLLQRHNTSVTAETVTLQAYKQVRTDTLPDGSVVISNQQTSISYPKTFSARERNIQLQGEAFFAVTPDKKRPFIIHTGNVAIRVVGTAFNVKNRDSSVEVVVESGIVQVTRNNETVTLHKGEKIIVAGNNAPLTKENTTDQLYNYYRSHKFVCDGTPLWKLVSILKEVHHVNIIIAKPSLSNLPLTSTFENESLDNILSVISSTFGITVVHEGDNIVLQ